MKLNKKGFTLVELLAVIVILAILMVVAFSVVPGLQNDAQKTGMDTELRKIIRTTYEDIQLISIGQATTYSYGVAPDSSTHKMTITEGSYTVVLTLSDNHSSITDFCISNKTHKSTGTLTGSSINYVDEYEADTTDCS